MYKLFFIYTKSLVAITGQARMTNKNYSFEPKAKSPASPKPGTM
jgi:hypothetical protein